MTSSSCSFQPILRVLSCIGRTPRRLQCVPQVCLLRAAPERQVAELARRADRSWPPGPVRSRRTEPRRCGPGGRRALELFGGTPQGPPSEPSQSIVTLFRALPDPVDDVRGRDRRCSGCLSVQHRNGLFPGAVSFGRSRSRRRSGTRRPACDGVEIEVGDRRGHVHRTEVGTYRSSPPTPASGPGPRRGAAR